MFLNEYYILCNSLNQYFWKDKKILVFIYFVETTFRYFKVNCVVYSFVSDS